MTIGTGEALILTRDERSAAGVACGAHALHDGFTDLIYVMLPVWQAEFGVGYAELGFLRALYAGTMACFQIPAGLLAERIGHATLLALGTAVAGAGYCLAGTSAGVLSLMLALFVSGLGSSTQHPLASSLMAHAFAGPRSMKAIGAYNFAGDVGKMALPALAAFLISVMPWRPVLALLGVVGVVAGAAVYFCMPRLQEHAVPANAGAGKVVQDRTQLSGRDRGLAFPLLVAIGMLDSGTRMGFLLFLPFVLTAKGASLPTLGLALTLVFTGGAAGKLVCSWIGARIGTVATVWLTESLTALLILTLLLLPLGPALIVLPVIGIVLNGTSSVLYGSVPDLVAPERRTRAFSVFYTGTVGTGAGAPVIYGAIGDLFGVTIAIISVALIVLLTLPLSLALKMAAREPFLRVGEG
jgi:FSR family fosmidomycin resistance protein-like MFS transporter